jgi:DNA-binding NtrC family response regulator
MERPVALVVDRDPAVRSLISGVFEQRGFVALGADGVADARDRLGTQSVSLMLIDLDSIGASAVDLIDHARRLRPQPLIVGLGLADAGEDENELLRAQLFDIAPKPIERERVDRLCRRSLAQLETLSQLRRLQTDLQSREGYHGIVGRSEAMERIRSRIESLAWSGGGVWIVGEQGAGKELTARLLHGSASSEDGEFVLVNCAELRNADALVAEDAALERAAGGTLYLENLPELRLDLQEDLLREIGQREHLADSERKPIRFIVGSREDATRAVAEGRLLQGLQPTLARTTLQLPPLRDRREDIALLANHFIIAICEINRLSPIRISPEALSTMERYDWPGNVQELRNAIEQAVILSVKGTIRAEDLPDRVREARRGPEAAPDGPGLSRRPFREVKREVVEAFEGAYLSELLERHGGNVTAASQQAGMLRSALQRLLRKYGLKSADFRAGRRRAERAAASESTDELR